MRCLDSWRMKKLRHLGLGMKLQRDSANLRLLILLSLLGLSSLGAEEGYKQRRQVSCEECINELLSKITLSPPLLKIRETDPQKTSEASLGVDATWTADSK